jgi:hypothetical protein
MFGLGAQGIREILVCPDRRARQGAMVPPEPQVPRDSTVWWDRRGGVGRRVRLVLLDWGLLVRPVPTAHQVRRVHKVPQRQMVPTESSGKTARRARRDQTGATACQAGPVCPVATGVMLDATTRVSVVMATAIVSVDEKIVLIPALPAACLRTFGPYAFRVLRFDAAVDGASPQTTLAYGKK